MNLEEEIKKSVPYNSIKNRKKMHYDISSDEDDLEFGFPTEQNVFAYNILKDLQAVGRIRILLEQTELSTCNRYRYLTLFEEMKIILHFAQNQNNSFSKKIKYISQHLKRDESFLNEYIRDNNYFQRFTKQNFNTLMQLITKDPNSNLIKRIEWQGKSASTSSINSNQKDQYNLKLIPNILIEDYTEQENSQVEKKSITSEQIYKEGEKLFNEQDKVSEQLQLIGTLKSSSSSLINHSSERLLKTKSIHTYFDSDSQESNDELDNRQQTQSKPFNKDPNNQNEIQEAEEDSDNQENSNNIEMNLDKLKQAKQYEDEEEENIINEGGESGKKQRNSLNAILAEAIEYEDIDNLGGQEDFYQREENYYFPYNPLFHYQNHSNRMVYRGVLNFQRYHQCLQIITYNQQLTVKQFLKK